MIVRPTMLYGAMCWPVKNPHVQEIKVAEVEMLRWMCGHIRRDKIKNEDIQNKVEAASVADKMRKARLRWFEYVKEGAQGTSEQVRKVATEHILYPLQTQLLGLYVVYCCCLYKGISRVLPSFVIASEEWGRKRETFDPS